MIHETINAWNGATVLLTISPDGYCYCPVCGEKAREKDWRPYDNEGTPSYDICSCGFEYGYDDTGEPPYDESWKRYRERWLNDEISTAIGKTLSKTQKIEQLKNLGIK
jgi:hypothetical protein